MPSCMKTIFLFLTLLLPIFALLHTTASLSQARYNLAATSVGNLAIFAGGEKATVSYELMGILIIIL